jgi:hypothetical protein
MQGTIVMLMALSGLGCHHRDCAPAVAPACYDSGYSAPVVADCAPCAQTSYVAPSCYSDGYSTGYSGCYSAGYTVPSGNCFSGFGTHRHHHGLFGWLCGRRRSCDVCDVPQPTDCNTCNGGGYAPAVFGIYSPVYSAGQVPAAAAPVPMTLEPAAAPPPPAAYSSTPPAPPTPAVILIPPATTTPPAPPAPPVAPAPTTVKPDGPPPGTAPPVPPVATPPAPPAPSLPSVAPPPVAVPPVPATPKVS